MVTGSNNESQATGVIILVDLSSIPTGHIKLNITKRLHFYDPNEIWPHKLA
jgi:hypothetical protein